MFYEKITKTEIDAMTLENGITPNYTYERYDIETETYINLEIKKTANEVYQECLNNKNKPISLQPTEQEILLKEIANLKVDNMKKDTIINSTLKTVAELKVQIMTMKGGNE